MARPCAKEPQPTINPASGKSCWIGLSCPKGFGEFSPSCNLNPKRAGHLGYRWAVRLKGSTALPRVLSSVANAAIAISSANASTSGGVYRAFRKFDELQSLSDPQLQGTVRHAIRDSYIVIRTVGGKRHIELTKKGRRSVQKSDWSS